MRLTSSRAHGAPSQPLRLKALRHVAIIESIGSSTRIEGSKLTDREVERLLANLEIQRFSRRDDQEVTMDSISKGGAEAVESLFSRNEKVRAMIQGNRVSMPRVFAWPRRGFS